MHNNEAYNEFVVEKYRTDKWWYGHWALISGIPLIVLISFATGLSPVFKFNILTRRNPRINTTSSPSGTTTTTAVHRPRWYSPIRMNDERFSHMTSLLTNDKMLVTGAWYGVTAQNSSELYDPFTKVWLITGNMNNTPYFHTASVLLCGKLFTTGEDNAVTPGSDELYDPLTETWTTTGNMNNTQHSPIPFGINRWKSISYW